MAGAAVDLFSAGLSLGTGMLIGAAAGGLWQGVEKLGKRVAGKLRGWREISVDDAVLRLLALRQRERSPRSNIAAMRRARPSGSSRMMARTCARRLALRAERSAQPARMVGAGPGA